MALLPLSRARALGEHAYMRTAATRQWGVIRRLARKVADVAAECNYATSRMWVLATAPDRYLPHPDNAPDTYAEFLHRTSGALAREPSARARARGRDCGCTGR